MLLFRLKVTSRNFLERTTTMMMSNRAEGELGLG